MIFGPVPSRRFGLSLGIDLSPRIKSCNFDCVYCELGGGKPTPSIPNPPSVKEIIAEVKKGLKRFSEVEVLTVTANGEPTLYPHLLELVKELSKIKHNKKLLILSNGSTISTVQEALKEFDIVKLSLDCATPRCFKKIDRPLKGIELKEIIEGIKEFRKTYKGLLVIEVLVVKGINDKEEEFKRLNEVLKEIAPDRVDVGTLDRPPAYLVEPVSYEKLLHLASFLEVPATVISKKKVDLPKKELSTYELLTLLSKRPITLEEAQALFNETTLQRLQELLKNGKVFKKSVGKVEFLTTSADILSVR
ncbi:MAG: radical SAM protein [Epsilonproteobacteria bacterium]|nr:radical SAM protein [Campylobacterota bacterium]